MYTILCNLKGSRKLPIDETHLKTIDRYGLFSDLLDSNGIVRSVMKRHNISITLKLPLSANVPQPLK